MTVGEMLARVDAFELSEWEAFERAFGPIGREYSDDMLASIHEQLQLLLYVHGGQYEDNPAPEPKRRLRPYEVFKRLDEGQDDDDEGLSPEEFSRLFD